MEDIKWYYFLNKDKYSLMNREYLNNNSCIICSETTHRKYAVFKSYFDFYKYANDLGYENNCFFEIIRGNFPQKPYFDIDISLKNTIDIEEKIDISNKIIPLLISIIMKKYPQIKEEDFMIFNSHGEDKRSFHIVIDNWCFPNYKQNKLFYNEIISNLPNSWKIFCDSNMYKSLQQFRILYSHKWETSRIKIFDPSCKWKCQFINSKKQEMLFTFISSLISNINYCKFLPIIIEDEVENFSQDLNDINIIQLMKIVNSIEDIKCYNIGNFSNSILCLNRITPSFCKICCRTHDKENTFVFVHMNNDVFFNCRRNEKSIKIGTIDQSLIDQDQSLIDQDQSLIDQDQSLIDQDQSLSNTIYNFIKVDIDIIKSIRIKKSLKNKDIFKKLSLF